MEEVGTLLSTKIIGSIFAILEIIKIKLGRGMGVLVIMAMRQTPFLEKNKTHKTQPYIFFKHNLHLIQITLHKPIQLLTI